MTRCRKHDPEWLFPTRDVIAPDKKADFAVMLLTESCRKVICNQCGCIGHKIKSRRGGIRWDGDNDRDYYINRAAKWWKDLCLEIPEFITKHTQQ